MKIIVAALTALLGLATVGASAPPAHTYTLTRYTLDDQQQPAFQSCLSARGQVGPVPRATYKSWTVSKRRAYDAAFWGCAGLMIPSDVRDVTYCYFNGEFHPISECDPAR